MRVLLHICCANCAIYPMDLLRSEGHEVMGFFFNPNIHPYGEFLKRKEAMERLSAESGLRVIFQREYPLEEFFRKVAFRESMRCTLCYQWRIETTAIVAKRGKFDAFTTTLLFSKHQAHDLIRQLGEAASRAKGPIFLYRDFRKGWEQGRSKSLEMGLYRQRYCGCLFSEAESHGLKRRAKSPQAQEPVAFLPHPCGSDAT
jgi:predicted adenine nucleotide alpha hydrolase (AANH) superfamily ATPase